MHKNEYTYISYLKVQTTQGSPLFWPSCDQMDHGTYVGDDDDDDGF